MTRDNDWPGRSGVGVFEEPDPAGGSCLLADNSLFEPWSHWQDPQMPLLRY